MVKVAEKKKRMHPLLPVMGVVIAVAVGIIAYFGAPHLIKLVRDQEFQGKTTAEFDREMGIKYTSSDQTFVEAVTNTNFHFVFAAFIWLISFGIAMTIVAAGIGEDPDKESTILHPREGDFKAAKKYVADQEKLQKRRAKQAEELRKRQEQEAKKKG